MALIQEEIFKVLMATNRWVFSCWFFDPAPLFCLLESFLFWFFVLFWFCFCQQQKTWHIGPLCCVQDDLTEKLNLDCLTWRLDDFSKNKNKKENSKQHAWIWIFNSFFLWFLFLFREKTNKKLSQGRTKIFQKTMNCDKDIRFELLVGLFVLFCFNFLFQFLDEDTKSVLFFFSSAFFAMFVLLFSLDCVPTQQELSWEVFVLAGMFAIRARRKVILFVLFCFVLFVLFCLFCLVYLVCLSPKIHTNLFNKNNCTARHWKGHAWCCPKGHQGICQVLLNSKAHSLHWLQIKQKAIVFGFFLFFATTNQILFFVVGMKNLNNLWSFFWEEFVDKRRGERTSMKNAHRDLVQTRCLSDEISPHFVTEVWKKEALARSSSFLWTFLLFTVSVFFASRLLLLLLNCESNKHLLFEHRQPQE